MKLIFKNNDYTFIMILFTVMMNFTPCSDMNLRKGDQFFNEDPEFADSNRTPIINIHMEDHDSDPINFRRFDGERKIYSVKLHELEAYYENEKKALSDVIALQTSKIAQLTEIADSTNNIMDFLIPKDEAASENKSISN